MVMPAYSLVTLAPSGHAISATKVVASRSSEGLSAGGKAGIGRDSKKSDMARTLLNGVVGDGLMNIDAGSRQEHSPQGRDQLYWGSGVANPDATPISYNVVDLLLLEQDRIHILREIQLMERWTIIAHVLGIRSSCVDLRLLLQAVLK